MEEVWLRVREFPGYSVSDCGRVRNDLTGRILTQVVNQQRVAYVGLCRDGQQFKRGVALLVADTFLPKHPLHQAEFDTPINLDGDRTNNFITNLMWRPRWFAFKYHKQFESGHRGFLVPIEDAATHEIFETSWDAATKYGLIDREIMLATLNRTYVWPTYQTFRILQE